MLLTRYYYFRHAFAAMITLFVAFDAADAAFLRR